jgi:hypothetical protein
MATAPQAAAAPTQDEAPTFLGISPINFGRDVAGDLASAEKT